MEKKGFRGKFNHKFNGIESRFNRIFFSQTSLQSLIPSTNHSISVEAVAGYARKNLKEAKTDVTFENFNE